MKAYNISQKKQSSTPQDSMSLKLAVQMSIFPIAMLPTAGYFDGSFLYAFLAERQNTNIAVTAVHTDEEMVFFAKFKAGAQMKEMIKCSAEVFASIWSTHTASKGPKYITSCLDILNRISTSSLVEKISINPILAIAKAQHIALYYRLVMTHS
ncbi:hypothetical protein [Parasitella parasitica]|uniref:Uncharacterized protein n=1 Tax=Parasitella parasitica TaxID=35722 RepID=A0A0B7N6E6_9FUNG|nr:hypothetical protein [Parasitella parasitica]